MIWRLYYGDGSAFDASMGSWADAPPLNPQWLLTREADVCLRWMGDVFLWWPHYPAPMSADTLGLLDYLREIGEGDVRLADLRPHWLFDRGVKIGRSLPEADWNAVTELALADPDFPRAHKRTHRTGR